MSKMRSVCVLLYVISCYFLAQGADKYTDENRPYEFGFTIEGEQHRHEKKDENGIIMGEFGFITADGVYHVTVYATDENGNFKIISMKNIRVKPYPTAPGVGTRQTSLPSNKQNQPIDKPSATENAAPFVGVRQGHSLSLPGPKDTPSKQSTNAIKQSKLENNAGPARSCSHCSVPTTTTAAPKILAKMENNQFTQNNNVQSQSPYNNPYGLNQGRPQESSNQGFLQQAGPNYSSPSYNQQGYSNQNSINANEQPIQVNTPVVSNVQQHNQQELYAYSNGGQTYQQSSDSGQDNGQNLGATNFSPFGKNDVQNSQEEQNYPIQHNTQNSANGPGIQSSFNSFSNSNTPYSQNGPSYPSISQSNGQSKVLGKIPASNIDGYRQPKSFDDILQSANPDQFYKTNAGVAPSVEGLPLGPGKIPEKPVLIAAQMQVVDKNTDVYYKKPEEKDGLPNGLDKNDMTQLLYTFNYTVGFHGHHENGYVNGAKIGYYYVTGRNGVRTRVDYVADENGFRPRISQEVLDILSDEVPKPETERDEKYGLKGYEFKWLYYPIESRRR